MPYRIIYILHNQDKLYKALLNKDSEKSKILIKTKTIDPTLNYNLPIRLASEHGLLEVLLLLLEDPKVDTIGHNISFAIASQQGHTHIVKKLLSNKIIDPTFGKNRAITSAINNEHNEVTYLLWSIASIKDTLEKDNIKSYNKILTRKIKNTILEF